MENIKINKLAKKDTKMLIIANNCEEMMLDYKTDTIQFVKYYLENNTNYT